MASEKIIERLKQQRLSKKRKGAPLTPDEKFKRKTLLKTNELKIKQARNSRALQQQEWIEQAERHDLISELGPVKFGPDQKAIERKRKMAEKAQEELKKKLLTRKSRRTYQRAFAKKQAKKNKQIGRDQKVGEQTP